MQLLDDDSHLVYALAGCGRRCATLSRGDRQPVAADNTVHYLASRTRHGVNLLGFMASVYERFPALK